MKSRNRVWVQLSLDGKRAIRIFRRYPYMGMVDGVTITVAEWPKKDAVESIRQQVFEKCEGECDLCGKPMTWGTMHMHEVLPKGKGGEVSIFNCIAICFDCHEGRKDSEHGDRRLRFGEIG